MAWSEAFRSMESFNPQWGHSMPPDNRSGMVVGKYTPHLGQSSPECAGRNKWFSGPCFFLSISYFFSEWRIFIMRPGGQLEELGQAGRHVRLLHGDMDFHVRLQGGRGGPSRTGAPGKCSSGRHPAPSRRGNPPPPCSGKNVRPSGGDCVNDIDVKVKVRLLDLQQRQRHQADERHAYSSPLRRKRRCP